MQISWSLCCAALIFALVLIWMLSRWRFYWLSWQLPGPPVLLPFIGNGLAFTGDPKDFLKKILVMTEPYGSPLRLWIGPQLVIFVKDPDQLQVIMQSSKFTDKSFIYSFLEPFMGQGLFTSRGTKHKNDRRLLQHLFGPKLLDSYCPLFQKHALNLVKMLEPHQNKDSFDVLHIIHETAFEATMDILVEDSNDHDVDYKVIPGFIRRFYYIFTQRILKFWLFLECIYQQTVFYKEQQEMTKLLEKFTKDIRDKQVAALLQEFEKEPTGNGKTPCRREIPSVLEMMIHLAEDNEELRCEKNFRDHMTTFVATSQDTQSSAIAFTLMMLGMHSSIQSKVMNELLNVLEGRKELTLEDTSKLKYMEMCIKESMRLFPLGPFLPRDVLQTFKLGKLTIPGGCSMILGVFNVHRNPKYWEKPNEFYPEHFLEEAASKRHPYAYLPFSSGPRRCIAQQYSYVNMKIIISQIMLNYELSCPFTLQEMELMTDVSIRPKAGYLIRIARRGL